MNVNKLKGALYAFAIGDAMGATTEFMNEIEIKEKYNCVKDIIGGGWLDLEAGEITDDTQMSMCVMKSLMLNDTDNFRENTIKEFISWYNSDPKDVGNQCSKALSWYINNHEYIFLDDNALGNGSLMRALPCALMNEEKYLNLNVIQGELTHHNKICGDIITEYTRIIWKYLNDEKVNIDVKELKEPTGYIINTYNNALYYANLDTIEEAIIGAVNHGGDSDTIAAITGSLIGARLGYGNIPKRWIDQLSSEVKEKLDEFINFIIKR